MAADPADHGDELIGAEADAAAVVRAAFAQATRLTAQAEADRTAAEQLLAEARAEADRALASVHAEREHLLESARRDRVAAEEALLRARAEAEREASEVLARATELARREAEVLLEGSRMELLKARDEAASIRARAERDAEAILAAAAARARSTSADILAATRRRLGDALGPAAAAPGPGATGEAQVVELADDRPPPEPDRPERSYRMDWERQPTDADIDAWVGGSIAEAMTKVFGGGPFGSRRRHRRPPMGHAG